ncbi:MAG: hypothetical protein KF749_16975 [Bacteroidetes bacterium]|nr:hypothetical protein [Bacteroidota bacterium]MCW5894115.1 hypothetical protein [Bacteroidota bacterium]
MNIFALVLIGVTAARVGRRLMRDRSYSMVDDMLWGILGALWGDSLAEVSGWGASGSVPAFVMACAGAAAPLLLTNFLKEKWPAPLFRKALLLSNRIDPRLGERATMQTTLPARGKVAA